MISFFYTLILPSENRDRERERERQKREREKRRSCLVNSPKKVTVQHNLTRLKQLFSSVKHEADENETEDGRKGHFFFTLERN